MSPMRIALGLLLVAALVGVALWLRPGKGADGRKRDSGPVPVVVTEAKVEDIRHLVDAVGTVQSLQAVVARSQIDGILTSLRFQEGDHVRKGQLLATIDDRAPKAALAAAEAQVARQAAELRLAELDLKRYQGLLERNAIARQTVDQQMASVAQLRAALALARANADTARVNLSFTRILSPVDGRVGIRNVDVGNFVRATDALGLVSVTQMNPISVMFPVPQARLGSLLSTMRTPGGADVEAIDRETGAALGRGRILAVDNSLNIGSGTTRVRAQFANPGETLVPGAFVSVRYSTGFSKNAVALPAAAVRPGVEGAFVYRVRDGKAERVDVKTGYSDDAITVVLSGIAPGDHIVIDGYSRLRPGDSVKPVRSATGVGATGVRAAPAAVRTAS